MPTSARCCATSSTSERTRRRSYGEQRRAVRTTGPAPPAIAKDISLSGRGDKVARLKLEADTAYVATITYSGGSNFAVWTVDSSGQQMDLLVNEIGRYSGVRPVALTDGEVPAALKIEADGAWKVILRDAAKAPRFTGKASGKGSAVYLVAAGTFSGLATATITHSGTSNFVVRAYGDDVDLLVNEIGKYRGEVLFDTATVLIEIEADGAWTITKT